MDASLISEAIPLLMEKSRRGIESRLPKRDADEILSLWGDPEQLERLPAAPLMERFIPSSD